jgi:Zn-dependent protease with chaperone function
VSLEPRPEQFASPSVPPPTQTVSVVPWPSEAPLFVLVLLASLGFIGLMLISIFGAIYGGLIAAVIFFGHLLFITHVRGNAVKLGPTQLPELHDRVQSLARRAGLSPVPDAYVMESGGALNAFATKFFRGRIIVLYTDLLEACGDDEAARDMVIGHELGHHKAGHLDWMWILAPGMLVPFLGAAYSRAREYTCDRWGQALCGDAQGGTRGLAILAAGGKLAKRVDLAAFVAQKQDLDTGWMTLGRWLSSYPTLGERIEALEPRWGAGVVVRGQGPMRAAGILGGCLLAPTVITMLAMAVWLPLMKRSLDRAAAASATSPAAWEDPAPAEPDSPETAAKKSTVRADLERLAAAVEKADAAGFAFADSTEVADFWSDHGDSTPLPIDPFTEAPYEFAAQAGDEEILVYSPGPDRQIATDDDIDRSVYLSKAPAADSDGD